MSGDRILLSACDGSQPTCIVRKAQSDRFLSSPCRFTGQRQNVHAQIPTRLMQKSRRINRLGADLGRFFPGVRSDLKYRALSACTVHSVHTSSAWRAHLLPSFYSISCMIAGKENMPASLASAIAALTCRSWPNSDLLYAVRRCAAGALVEPTHRIQNLKYNVLVMLIGTIERCFYSGPLDLGSLRG
ncbi:hypothetical protein BDW74DRAFT_149330 [Aspergillus multicolor]|uniref:uncharacterized protein n=1 Tax=Aspergillus multicolor TaxID=41759 RepID=UPI003CCCE24E